MSGKHISLDTMLGRVDEIIQTNHLRPDYVWFTPNGVKTLAREIPAADVVEVVRGKWIHFSRSSECSVCGYDTGKYEAPSNYCPHCGADMREKQEE